VAGDSDGVRGDMTAVAEVAERSTAFDRARVGLPPSRRTAATAADRRVGRRAGPPPNELQALVAASALLNRRRFTFV